MGNYSVPPEIRKLKPRGTCVKNIKGHYYVYEQTNIKDESGKWRRKSGACIGKIEVGIGFVSNKIRYYDERITTLEYGQYAITLENTKHVLHNLLEFFEKEDAYRIYILSVIHFANAFQHRKAISTLVEQSYISLLYPSLKFSDESLSELLDQLGRRQERVIKFQQNLLCKSSGKIAVDGHVVQCCSHQNDAAAFGNKYKQIKDMQFNILMAYDVENNNPLFSKIYEGGTVDKCSIQDMVGAASLKNMLFIVDRGFYSASNIKLFSSNGNRYVIPLSENLSIYKKAVEGLTFSDSFVYEKNKKRSAIQYYEKDVGGKRVLVFRDCTLNAIEAESYRKNIGTQKSCTQKRYEELKEFFGTIVLQTNLDKPAKEVYSCYKKRWGVETFFNSFKNTLNYKAFYEQDYYKLEGMSFIMLVTGIIYEEMNKVTAPVKNKFLDDCMLDARMVKIHYENNVWVRTNMKEKLQSLFTQLNVDYTSPII